MEGAYEKQLVDFLLPNVKDKIFFDVGGERRELYHDPVKICQAHIQL